MEFEVKVHKAAESILCTQNICKEFSVYAFELLDDRNSLGEKYIWLCERHGAQLAVLVGYLPQIYNSGCGRG